MSVQSGNLPTSSNSITDAETYQSEPGEYRYLQVKVSNNASTTASANFMINGAYGNMSARIPASTTGTFTDLINTDTVIVGDECAIRVDRNSTLATVGVNVHFQPTDKRWIISKYGNFLGNGGYNYTGINVTRYQSICGDHVTTTATESNATHMQTDCDFFARNLRVTVSVNTRLVNTIVRFRNGTTNGNMSITIPAGGVGTFVSDPLLEDFVTSGTRPGFSITLGNSGVGAFRPSVIGVDCYATASVGESMIWTKDGANFNTTASIRSPILGALAFINSGTLPVMPFRCAGRLDMFRVYVSINTKSTTTSLQLVKNAVNTGIIVSIPGGVTGEFSNLTSQNYFVTNNTYNWLVTTLSAENLTLEWTSARIKYNQGNKPIGSWF